MDKFRPKWTVSGGFAFHEFLLDDDRNTKQYTTLNDFVSDTVEKIREGKNGKYTTYNVANFMQKIAKYIPENVELQTISSDDNKSVTIVAKSSSYAELGYFISQLKLKGILTNIKTGNVQTGSYITVTIGGDLPWSNLQKL